MYWILQPSGLAQCVVDKRIFKTVSQLKPPVVFCSLCLLGVDCRYDGKNQYTEKLDSLIPSGASVVGFCPEVLGGLSVPRPPCEIQSSDPWKIITIDGEDQTVYFQDGSEIVVTALKTLDRVDLLVLKEKSPSCGSSFVYSGKFDGTLIEGHGILLSLIESSGVHIERVIAI
ncbi:hypothetical protein GEMRC1_006167 [Eukaryota sp. GEM-RC1]